MEIKYSVTIKKDEYDIDMHYGLESFKGASDLMSLVAESILKDRVAQNITHKNVVRTKLKNSFRGSYGLNFVLEVSDPVLERKLRKIGKDVFTELISYFIYEALYLEHKELSDKANFFITKLDNIHDELIKRVREPLKKMHQVSKVYGYDIFMNYEKPGKKQEVAYLNTSTIVNLTSLSKSENDETLEIIVNRFNTFTGNGRLVIRGEDETTAFGFGTGLNEVRVQLRKVLSKNLHDNNAINIDGRKYITIIVQRMLLPTQETVKLIIKGIHVNEI